MIKKLFIIPIVILFFLSTQGVFAKNLGNNTVNVYFFLGSGCPLCKKEMLFLDKMQQKYPQIKINEFEISHNATNSQLMIKFGKKLNVAIGGVPFTVIGKKYIIGWLDEYYTGRQIESAILCVLHNNCGDIGAELIINHAGKSKQSTNKTFKEASPIPETLTLPLVGKIKTKNLSLPVLTLLLGALDGFNPCAMWTLLFLISLLLGMNDKKRMLILGGGFIVASASVYFLFMAAWLNLLLFIGFLFWIRVIIGFVAFIGGGYNLKEYFVNKEAVCKVTGAENRQKVFEKLKNITQQKNFYLALGGIILLAFAVNVVELICSAGLPVIFTQILTFSHLSSWQYYAYILLYILIFMLDDLIVFIVAMTTLQIAGIATRYSRLSNLIGGLFMLVIGLLIILKPEWLMFG